MKLSIIVPVYNGEMYIENLIKNILQQSYKDFELILINDGSKDNTKEVCDNIKDLDPRIKIIHKENEGVSATRNRGIDISSGEYITFLDCDDRIDFSMYTDMINKIKENNRDLVMCSYRIEYDTHSDDKVFPWNDREFIGDEIVNKISINMMASTEEDGKVCDAIMGSTCRCVFKKDIIDKHNLRFDESLKIAEDLIFMLEYLNLCNDVYTMNKCYYFYNRKTDQLSATQKYHKDLEKTLDKVDENILRVLKNVPDLQERKIWALRQVTHIYSLVVNASSKARNVSFSVKKADVKDIVKRRKYKEYLSKLNKNEVHGLNSMVIKCLKYGFYSIVIKYYSR
ncbi:MAG: glycosyltransferase family 2 protein [Sarcina sp.]